MHCLTPRLCLGRWGFGRIGWVAGQDNGTYQINVNQTHVPDHQCHPVVERFVDSFTGAHLEDPPDPYAKLYLLPEKSKKSKRKTEVMQSP